MTFRAPPGRVLKARIAATEQSIAPLGLLVVRTIIAARAAMGRDADADVVALEINGQRAGDRVMVLREANESVEALHARASPRGRIRTRPVPIFAYEAPDRPVT